jgi:flagellar biosynthesis protein FlhB
VSERRPFPPSPRRRALAQQVGLSAASPLIGGALACGAAIAVAFMLARAAAAQIGVWIARACDQPAIDHASGASSDSHAASGASFDSHAASGASFDSHAAGLLDLGHVPGAVLQLALPLLGAAAIAAVLAHVAQNRSVWMPRRRIAGAPVLPRGGVGRASFELVSATVIGAVAFGWLWLTAPRLAVLLRLDAMTSGVGAAIASVVVSLAIAWLVLGVVDALVRHTQLAGVLAMTPQEKREDDRLSATDPRWARLRRSLGREPAVGPAVARAAVVVLGDDEAVAIAFDPTREPLPTRTATGRRARATQLVALARRHRVPVHRDAELAHALVAATGPVPEAQWARLAEIVAAVRGR